MAASIASTSLLVSMLFLSGAIATPKFDFFSKFDFFYLVLTWPGAPCSKGNICCLPTTRAPEVDFYVKDMHPYKYWWTIFGWTGQDVTDCNDTPFVADELENQTRLYMDKYWANIKCPCNNGLSNWEHVWSKFGTCSGLTQNEYFKKTLQLRSKLNLLRKLRTEHIWPRDNKDYSLNIVHDAINNAVGQQTATVCAKGEPDLLTKPWVQNQLHEIWLCVDKDATKIIPCPIWPQSLSKSNCEPRLYYSAFTLQKMKECPFNPIQLPTFLSE